MHRSANTHFVLTVAMALLVASSCSKNEQTETVEPVERVAKSQPAKSADGTFQGRVMETMDSGGYTYAQIDLGDKAVWAAGPVTPLTVGQEVGFKSAMPMQNFQSKTLDRQFDVVYFTDHFHLDLDEEHAQAKPAEHPAVPGAPAKAKAASAAEDLSGIAKAADGWTVAELYRDKAVLAGNDVLVRGKVVKALANIMGRNWLHIQDGSGEAGSDDLTVTTAANAQVGQIVQVRGKLTADKDFGSGYFYDLIIEDAAVTVE